MHGQYFKQYSRAGYRARAYIRSSTARGGIIIISSIAEWRGKYITLNGSMAAIIMV